MVWFSDVSLIFYIMAEPSVIISTAATLDHHWSSKHDRNLSIWKTNPQYNFLNQRHCLIVSQNKLSEAEKIFSGNIICKERRRIRYKLWLTEHSLCFYVWKDSFCIFITGTFYVMHTRLIERSRNECVGKLIMKFIQNKKLVVKENCGN